MAKNVLEMTAGDILKQIDNKFQEAYIAVRKKKTIPEVWDIWGDFMVEMKIGLENAIQSTGIPYIGHIYAYLQNRNQIITINLESRIGKIGMKKDLIKSGNILLSLITGLAKTGPVDEVNEKVKEHLDQLYFGRRYDLIAGKTIYADDYPQKEKNLQEPKTILAPVDLMIKEKSD